MILRARLYADEDFPSGAVQILRTLGHDVVTVQEAGRCGTPDADVLAEATADGRVAPICQKLGITSHGLAMFLLEAADDKLGVACLGASASAPRGKGFLRFSCAESDDCLKAAVAFLKDAVKRTDRVALYLETHPKYRLQ